jgi:hypothetical protein
MVTDSRGIFEVTRHLREIIGDAGIHHSRRVEVRLRAAVDLIEAGDASSTVRDLGAVTQGGPILTSW